MRWKVDFDLSEAGEVECSGGKNEWVIAVVERRKK